LNGQEAHIRQNVKFKRMSAIWTATAASNDFAECPVWAGSEVARGDQALAPAAQVGSEPTVTVLAEFQFEGIRRSEFVILNGKLL
jgi:hypothetical protein